jgi:hypothetical protein
MPASDRPIDYTAADCAVLAVPLADRPAGDIRYRQKLTYGEQYTYNSGSFQRTTITVPWSVANDFIDFALGYTTWDRTEATRFHRVLPMRSPYQATMFVESCDLEDFWMDQATNIPTSETVNYWMRPDQAAYQLVFRPRLYDLLTDEEVDGSSYPWAAHGCKELGRYVQRIVRYVAEERKVPQYYLDVQNPVTLAWQSAPDCGFSPVFRAEVVYHWFQVPEDAIPIDAIANCAARVNDAAFDKKRNVADTGWVDRWAAETLLFKGPGAPFDPYSGPNGERLVDVEYVFAFQPKGHNKFPPPDPTSSDWWPVRIRGVSPDKPLYPTADFRTLFKPRAS